MVMVIFTICCLILIAIVWPRAFFGTLGVAQRLPDRGKLGILQHPVARLGAGLGGA
jgi:hypothetical protein